eukprot:TRINITY_DN8566_c0_g1_i13.p1 TRINITY_DN8566_c0_g1~~TRINITY_DN8566_c0_g1_i13.p1  ORF type:complete len:132 (+),score=44.31 TRINITY_DN8566_c0_g1_i13:79-474(+)
MCIRDSSQTAEDWFAGKSNPPKRRSMRPGDFVPKAKKTINFSQGGESANATAGGSASNIAELNSQIQKRDGVIEDLNRTVATLKNALTQKENECQALVERVKTLEAEIDSLRAGAPTDSQQLIQNLDSNPL